MPRAIWKGAVSFGLVSVPVKLYAATESHDISFRQVHAKDGGRIKYQRVCSIDGEEVAYADIAKGYETDDGQMVVLDDDDFAELPASSSREISVEKFVPSEQIEPMWLEKSYYLEPEQAAAKPYALLREALKEADRVAVVTVSLRTRMTTAVLRVRDDVIVMQTHDVARRDPQARLRRPRLRGPRRRSRRSCRWRGCSSRRWPATTTPTTSRTTTRRRSRRWCRRSSRAARSSRSRSRRPRGGEVVDLLAALQKSVDAAKSSRGESTSKSDSGTKSTTKKAASKKSTAKKTPAKKTEKKSTAKKSTTKKAAKKAS